MRGSAFMASLPRGGDPGSIEAREALVLDAIRQGIAQPIAWAPVQTKIPGHTGTVYVASDTLRFGVPGPNADPTDWDWVRIAVTADTAQKIADELGVLLPTDKIADLAHAQADVRLQPHIQSPVTATTAGMLQHHAAIEADRTGREGLISTVGKEWILGNELSPPPWGGPPAHPLGYDGAINYGWHTDQAPGPLGPYVAQPGVVVWQSRGLRHNRKHVDYSQWVPRFVAPWMDVDGKRVRTADVMQSPALAGLVSYEGPLRSVRLPDPPHKGQNKPASGPAEAAPTTESADPFAEAGAITAAYKDIDLAGYTFRFGNHFPDATFLGLHFSGLCGGMATAVLDFFNARRPAPTTTKTPSTTEDPLGRYVKARQVDSLASWNLARFASMLADPDDQAIARQSAVAFQELRDAIDKGIPVVIGLIPPFSLDPRKVTGAHQVVAHGYLLQEDGTKTVLIWDPSRPLVTGNHLWQAPGALHWIEPASGRATQATWRGWFVESGYTPKEPPRGEGEDLMAANDAGDADEEPLAFWAPPPTADDEPQDPFAETGGPLDAPPGSSGPCDPFADHRAEHAESGVNAFGLNLFGKIRQTRGNLALSPVSIWTALAMPFAGARGETSEQMARTLDGHRPSSEIVPAAGEIVTAFNEPHPGMTLRLASRLFGARGYPFYRAYLRLTRETFGAPLEPVDFGAPEATRERINGWVAERTEQRIRDILPAGSIDSLTRLVLVNAIYFLGKWAAPFEGHATRPSPFRTSATNTGPVPTMHQTGRFRFGDMDGVKLVELPYRNNDLAMLFALPAEVDGLPALEARLSPALLESWTSALAPARVFVRLPKFQIAPEGFSLGAALKALGMPLAFDPARADFTGIADPPTADGRLFLADVFHKAFVKVDEEGTEAAAATGAVMSARSISVETPPKDFNADHPFLFFLRDTNTGLLLFMGRVSDPGSAGGGRVLALNPMPEPPGVPRAGEAGAPGDPFADGEAGAAGDPFAEASPAPALLALCRQLNAGWPARSRASDGILAGAAHHAAYPRSDHERGNALDVTYDPTHGPDMDPQKLVDWDRRRWAQLDPGEEIHVPVAWLGVEAGDPLDFLQEQVLDPLHKAAAGTSIERGREAQRDYLATTWVGDSPLGRFLQLRPSRPSATPAQGNTFELYAKPKPVQLVPEASGPPATGAAVPLEVVLEMRREGGETPAPLSHCVITPEERAAAEARLRERAGVMLHQLRHGALDEDLADIDDTGDPRRRLYEGTSGGSGLVLVHGLTPEGIDDPRLVRLARALAGAGPMVVTPEIPGLVSGHLDAGAADAIGAAVVELAERTGAPVGLVGTSLAGGIALCLAADPRFSPFLHFVLAIGGHHDLGRVARFCRTGEALRADGGTDRLDAHPDGRRLALAYGDAGAAVDVFHALSPAHRLGDVAVPVFVLHGAADNLIPAAEAGWIARDLPRDVLRQVLVSPALSHVEIGGETGGPDDDELVGFLAGVLRECDPPDEAGDGDGIGGAANLLGSGISAVAGAAGGDRVGKEAATGAAVGAAAGAVLEAVPVAGPILHAVAVLAGAIGGAISGALRDTYQPTPLQSAIALLLCHLCPGMIYAGHDTITTETKNAPAMAARLARYWRIVAGIAQPSSPLYNPRDTGHPLGTSDANPYLEAGTPDPDDPLTDARFDAHVLTLVRHYGHQPAAPQIPSLVRTPAYAKALLAALRSKLAESGVLQWDAVRTNLRGLRIAVARARALAGESGRDAQLEQLLGGDVTPRPAVPRRVRPPRRSRPAPPVHVSPAPAAQPRGEPMHPHVSPGDPFQDTGEAGAPSVTPPRLRLAAPGDVREAGAPGDPFVDAGAPIGIAPETAIEQLLAQIDRRYPYRGKGPIDGIADDVLRITDDPGLSGPRRTGPDLAVLDALVRADPRTLRTQVLSDRTRARYLAILVHPASLRDIAPWDLGVNGADEAGYPALPRLAALQKLEMQLDAAWPNRRRQTGGNVSDAATERDRGVLVVPESPEGIGPDLATLRAAVDRDSRVVETEIVTPSLLRSRRIVVPTLRIWTAEHGDDASPWDLTVQQTGPGWVKYRETGDAAALTREDLDALYPPAPGLMRMGVQNWLHRVTGGLLGEAGGVDAGEAGFPWLAGLAVLVGYLLARLDPPSRTQRPATEAEAIAAYRAAVAKGLTDQQLAEGGPKLLSMFGGRAGCEHVLDALEGTKTPDSLTDEHQRSLYNLLSGAFRGGEPGDLFRSTFRDLGGAPGARKLLAALYDGGPTADLTPLGQRVARTIGSKVRATPSDTKGPAIAENPPFPVGWKQMQDGPTAEMTAWARAIVADTAGHPMFSTDTKAFDGARVLARVEWHAGDDRHPAVHRGVSLFVPGAPPSEAGAPGDPFTDRAAVSAALEALLRQLDQRWPSRKKGADRVDDHALRITDDDRTTEGHIDRGTRLAPDLYRLRRAALADPRTQSAELHLFWAERRYRHELLEGMWPGYLEIVVRPEPALRDDPSAWDLALLDVPPAAAPPRPAPKPTPRPSAPGDASAALTALARQIDRRYPDRAKGRQDGMQVHKGRYALAITDDKSVLPPLGVLADVLRADPRVERAEILTPDFWNALDTGYLRIVTREGQPSEDGRAWNLAALGTGEAGEPATDMHRCRCCGEPVCLELGAVTCPEDLGIRCGWCLAIFCHPCALKHFGPGDPLRGRPGERSLRVPTGARV